MVSWAFSLAAGGLFPALVLGVWWKRANSAGAVAGMIAGFGSASTICWRPATARRLRDMWSGLSTATAEQLAKFEELKAAFAAAAPDAQAAAWTALDKHAS